MNNIQPIWLRYGVIYGVITIIISSLTYYAMSVSSWILSILSFGIMVFIMLLAGKVQRNDDGGFISYGKAFQTTFLTAFVGTAISVLFTIVLINLLDPGLADTLTTKAIEESRSTMEKLGMAEDQIDQAMESVEEASADSFTPLKQLTALLFSAIFIAVFAAIVSLFLKKDKPAFYEEEMKTV